MWGIRRELSEVKEQQWVELRSGACIHRENATHKEAL